MQKKSHIKISLNKDGWTRKVESLCWQGDNLVDYIGCHEYELNGKILSRNIHYGYKFDRAISTSDGKYVVLYEAYGTKGIIVKDNWVLREINRSYYFANAYEYPVTIFHSQDGRLCIAHCPEKYNILEIDDLETGEKLTAPNQEGDDFFQSRLEATLNGKYILSAGWVWQPVDAIEIFDLSENISHPRILNLYRDEAFQELGLFEINSAAFATNSTLILTGSCEEVEDVKYICVFDIEKTKLLSKAKITEPAGILMPINEEYVLGFYENPKLINLKTGEIVHKWAEISSDKQNSSINPQNEPLPPIAFDRENKRFAIADLNFIHVICLG